MIQKPELKLQMVDLNRQYQNIKPEIDSAIQEVLDSTAFIKGPAVAQFEKNLAQYVGANHAIACANGTDALQIVMMAMDFKPGDEIIVPSFTFIASAEVIALLGLVPVFADVDFETFNISIDSIKRLITPKTKAIIPVHLFGQCCDMDEIIDIAKANNLKIIEDAAQSIGSKYTSRNEETFSSGVIGDAGTTSFFPSKNLGCYGDGGAIFTNDDALAAQMRAIANHGMVVRYHHDAIGINSRLDTIQAAILGVKLKYLNNYNAARQQAANYYDQQFSKQPLLQIPTRNSKSTHVFHQYTLKLAQSVDREAFKSYLEKHEIPCMIYYPIPLHKQKSFENNTICDTMDISEKLSKQVVSIPMHTELSKIELEYITNTILAYFE